MRSLFAVILIFLSVNANLWSHQNKNCASLLNVKEVQANCGRENIKLTTYSKYDNACSLVFETTGTQLGQTSLELNQFINTNESQTQALLNFNKPKNAQLVSGIGDGAWIARNWLNSRQLMSMHEDRIGFSKGTEYVELTARDHFCNVEVLKELAAKVANRLTEK